MDQTDSVIICCVDRPSQHLIQWRWLEIKRAMFPAPCGGNF